MVSPQAPGAWLSLGALTLGLASCSSAPSQAASSPSPDAGDDVVEASEGGAEAAAPGDAATPDGTAGTMGGADAGSDTGSHPHADAGSDAPGGDGSTAAPLPYSPFGLVHGCTPGGYQNNWWDVGGGTPADLAAHVSSSLATCGMEIPLILTSPNWDDTTANITTAMTAFFSANPTIPVWQFGHEENIAGRCCSDSNLATLTQELQGVAAARTASGVTGAKLAYQMVFGMGNPYLSSTVDVGTLSDFQALIASPAAAYIDYLAIHPYAWNNYPTPETWEEQYLSILHGYVASSPNPNMRIIYTEGGAPVCDSADGGVDPCTLDEYGTTVRGQGQAENAAFYVKHHVLAFHSGVDMIAWYQGGTFGGCTSAASDPSQSCNGTGTTTCAENCFNLSPVTNAALNELQTCMSGMSRSPTYRAPQNGVRVYEFGGPAGTCTVAWTYLDGTTEVLDPTVPVMTVPVQSLTSRTVRLVHDVTGQNVPFANGAVTLSPSPVLVYTN